MDGGCGGLGATLRVVPTHPPLSFLALQYAFRMTEDPSQSFMFFYNFVQRNNITLDHNFDAMQTSYQCMSATNNYLVDDRYSAYFDVFRKYYPVYKKQAHLFWYICTLYFVPVYTLQRFYSFLQVETWKVLPAHQPVPYDEVRTMSKPSLLQAMQAYVDKGDVYLHMLIQAILHFF